MKTQASVSIDRPREHVFDCMSGMTFIQLWIAPFHKDVYTLRPEGGSPQISKRSHTPEIRQVSQGKIGVGTTFKQSNEFSGHPLEALIEVTQYKAPEVFAIRVTTEIGRAETEWILHSISDGTLAHLTFDVQPQGIWTRVVLFITSMITKKSEIGTPYYMERIKEYIEQKC